MPRRGFCASCGREVWLGRDGGCQFGHPASQLSNVHEAAAAPPAQPARVPSPAASAPPPVVPAPAAPAVPPSVPAASAAQAPALVPSPALAPVPAPDDAWGRTPDDVEGGGAYSFDYMSLTPDVSIGYTDCLARRAFARILDNLVIGFVTGIMMTPVLIGVLESVRSGHPPVIPTWPYPASFALEAAYFVLLPLVWQGRTPGKALLGIAVTDFRGQPPSLGKLLVREIGWILDGLFGGIVGLVYASKNPRNQRIGDVWAETVVVRTR